MHVLVVLVIVDGCPRQPVTLDPVHLTDCAYVFRWLDEIFVLRFVRGEGVSSGLLWIFALMCTLT